MVLWFAEKKKSSIKNKDAKHKRLFWNKRVSTEFGIFLKTATQIKIGSSCIDCQNVF